VILASKEREVTAAEGILLYSALVAT
jgi:hypothetical protein